MAVSDDILLTIGADAAPAVKALSLVGKELSKLSDKTRITNAKARDLGRGFLNLSKSLGDVNTKFKTIKASTALVKTSFNDAQTAVNGLFGISSDVKIFLRNIDMTNSSMHALRTEGATAFSFLKSNMDKAVIGAEKLEKALDGLTPRQRTLALEAANSAVSVLAMNGSITTTASVVTEATNAIKKAKTIFAEHQKVVNDYIKNSNNIRVVSLNEIAAIEGCVIKNTALTNAKIRLKTATQGTTQAVNNETVAIIKECNAKTRSENATQRNVNALSKERVANANAKTATQQTTQATNAATSAFYREGAAISDLMEKFGQFMSRLKNFNSNLDKSTGGVNKIVLAFGRFRYAMFTAIFMFHLGKRFLTALLTSMNDAVEQAHQLQVAFDELRVSEETVGFITQEFSYYVLDANDNISALQTSVMTLTDYLDAMAKSWDVNSASLVRGVAQFKSMFNAMNLASNMAEEMSINLEAIAFDVASLWDTDQQTVVNKFQSAMSGQTRAIRVFGYDITEQSLVAEAALEGFAISSVDNLTQSEKAILRYNAIVRQSADSHGDWARSIDTPANQLRRLKEAITGAAQNIGAMLIPAINAVLPILNALAKAVAYAASAIVSFFGGSIDALKAEAIGLAGTFSDYDTGAIDDASSSFSDAAGSAGDAASAAEEYKKQLLGIDEINNLTPETDSSGGSGGGGGSGGSGLDGLSLLDYNAIFGSGQTEVQKLIDDLRNALDTGGWSAVGDTIATKLQESLHKIPWQQIFKGFGNVGSNIANLINGFVGKGMNDGKEKIGWTIGQALAGAINAGLRFLYSFVRDLNFGDVGRFIGDTISAALLTINWGEFGYLLGARVAGLADFISSAIAEIDWFAVIEAALGIINGVLRGFFETLKGNVGGYIVAAFMGLSTILKIQGFGSILSLLKKLPMMMLTTFGTAFQQSGFGTKIGSMISKGLETAASLAKNAISSLKIGFTMLAERLTFTKKAVDAESASMNKNTAITLRSASSQYTAAAGAKAHAAGQNAANAATKASTTSMRIWGTVAKIALGVVVLLVTLLITAGSAFASTADGTESATSKIQEFATKATDAIKGFVNILMNAELMSSLGQAIGDVLLSVAQNLPTILTSIVGAVSTVFTTILSNINSFITPILQGVIGLVKAIVECLPTIMETLISALLDIAMVLVDSISEWLPMLILGAISLITALAEHIGEIIVPLIEMLPKVVDAIVKSIPLWLPQLIQAAVQLVAALVRNLPLILTSLVKAIGSMGASIGEGFKAMWSAIWESFKESAVNGFNSLKEKAGSVFENIKTTITDKIQSAKDKFKEIIDKIKSFLNFKWSLPDIKLPHLRWDSSKGFETSGALRDALEFLHLPTGIPGISVDWYASGGMPDTGQLFIARERGPEMVGKMGNQTTVANNQQIVDGIAKGVASANQQQNQLLAEQNTILKQLLNKNVSVSFDGRDVITAINRTNRTAGRQMIAGIA